MAAIAPRMLVQLGESELEELIRAVIRQELGAQQPAATSTTLPRQLTVDEVATELRCSTRHVRKLIALGRIKTTRLTHGRSSRVHIPRTELERLIKESTGE